MWEWSFTMEKARSGNGYGCVPLSWADFHAFFLDWGVKPHQWQITALRAMETIWLEHRNKKTEETPKAKAGRTFSLGLFDAWFGK